MATQRLITKAEEVIEVLNMMIGSKSKLVAKAYPDLQHLLTALCETTLKGSESNDWWKELFLVIGNKIVGELGVSVADNDRVMVFVDLLLEKHKMYGAGPITRWGELGVLIRIDSKYQRVLNLRQPIAYTKTSEILEREESFNDTLWDILGYCILGYLFVRSKT